MIILVDLGDQAHDMAVSNAGWRETVEILSVLGVLSLDRAEQLEKANLFNLVRVTEDEAMRLGSALLEGPVSNVEWSANVYPPDSYWKKHSRTPEYGYDESTYLPSWLRAFSGFCLNCRGFLIC